MEIIIFEKKTFEEFSMKLESFIQKVSGLYNGIENKRLRKWLDSEDVCRTLNVSPRTLQTLRDNGTLAFSKLGNKVYYLDEDLQRIIPTVEIRRERIGKKGRNI